MIPIFDDILGKFSKNLAIDLGTANTLIFVEGKGIIIREPSVVALHKKTKKIVAIGSEAKKMVGRTPANLVTIRPMKSGVISDYDTTLAMLSHFVKKIHDLPGKIISFQRPKIVISVPSQVTEVERRALLNVAKAAGAREAFLIEEAMAAALGAGLVVSEPEGAMVVDIGGGTTEISVISLGGVVVGRHLKIGGDQMDLDIANYIRLRWGLSIGEKSAEDIKISLGSAYPLVNEKEMIVRGRDLEKGLPKTVKVTSAYVREALSSVVNSIVGAVKDTIHDAPPELAADIAEKGIFLSGGGSLLRGLAKLISQETKMKVTLADDPLSCVVRGCAVVLSNRDLLQKVKVAQTS